LLTRLKHKLYLSLLTVDIACKLGVLSIVMFMPKGNPSPVITPEFKARQFKRSDGTVEPLSKKTVFVRLPESIDTVVQTLPNRSAWLRRVITEAAQRELMKDSSEAARE
jgi:hypothetical protein